MDKELQEQAADVVFKMLRSPSKFKSCKYKSYIRSIGNTATLTTHDGQKLVFSWENCSRYRYLREPFFHCFDLRRAVSVGKRLRRIQTYLEEKAAKEIIKSVEKC